MTCWFDAFARLDGLVEQKTKTVVLLDEISWWGMFDVNFPGELKYAWDNRFSKRNKLIVVLCGSVSSWIDKNILKSKGDEGLNPTSGKRAKQAEYRICDNYRRFYLKYIEPSRSLIKRNAYRFMSVEQLPGWNSTLGLQFEALVYNNMGELLKWLDLDSTLLLSASPFQQRKTARKEGCQIDLLLQTKHSIYIIEIKRRKNIDEEVVSEVKEKIRRLKITRGINVIPVLVYDGKLSKRVAADGYFSRIISTDQLLGKEAR